MPPEMEKKILNNYKFIFEGDKGYQPFMSLHLLENKFKINMIAIKTFFLKSILHLQETYKNQLY